MERGAFGVATSSFGFSVRVTLVGSQSVSVCGVVWCGNLCAQ